jgi:hypothetical protein
MPLAMTSSATARSSSASAVVANDGGLITRLIAVIAHNFPGPILVSRGGMASGAVHGGNGLSLAARQRRSNVATDRLSSASGLKENNAALALIGAVYLMLADFLIGIDAKRAAAYIVTIWILLAYLGRLAQRRRASWCGQGSRYNEGGEHGNKRRAHLESPSVGPQRKRRSPRFAAWLMARRGAPSDRRGRSLKKSRFTLRADWQSRPRA